MQYYKALKKFLDYLTVEKNFSKGTIKEYEKDLTLLADFVKSEYDFEELEIKDINYENITSFLANLVLENNCKAVTRNKRLYVIRSFMKYLEKNNIIKDNPANKIESSRMKKFSEPVYLTDKDVVKLLNVINKDNSWYPIRDRAIVLTFVYTGLRLSELVNLNLRDIDHEKQQITVVGKGNKERKIPLHNKAIKAIDHYVYKQRRKFKNNMNHNALFMSNRGKRITPSSIEKMITKYVELSSITKSKKISPHKLRHTFATRVYKETKDLKVLQELLGHEQLSTTQIYTHTDHEERKDAVDKLPDY